MENRTETRTELQGLFEHHVHKRLGVASNICEERGSQYGDTWRNNQWLIVRAVASRLGVSLDRKTARKLAAAVMCDIKYQRFEGGFKTDHCDDSVNYYAFLAGIIDDPED